MDKLETLMVLVVALALASAGAVLGDVFSDKTMTAVATKEVRITVDVKSDGKAEVSKGDKVLRTMSIPYPEGVLSMSTYVKDGKAYMSITGYISIFDVTSMRVDANILHSMGITKVELFLDSQGGDAYSGLAITDELERMKRRGFHITIYASGVVASAAVPILAVGDKRIIAPSIILMIHEAALWKWPGRETASDIKAQNKLLELIRLKYINKLVAYTKLSATEWEDLERVTTWFGAKEALKWGLADEIG